MKLACARGRHDAASPAIRNQGLEFARCRRCGRDLVRSRQSWRAVPPGFRVVWRSSAPEPGDAASMQLLLDLAPVGRALALLGRPRRRGALLIAFELAMLALRGIGEAIAMRLRAWRAALDAPNAPVRTPRLPAS